MNKIIVFIVGIIVGALSWAIVPVVSNSFEPFDSSLGFYLGQLLLCLATIYVGYKLPIIYLAVLFVGLHIGQNSYAFLFGSGEARAWFLLGLITTLSLLIYPLIAGLTGYIIQRTCKKAVR